MIVKFNHVRGRFVCDGLTSLQRCPKIVDGDFYCIDDNISQLSSLEGSPKTVGGDFRCNHNKLKSLEGSPKIVHGIFNCSRNKLTSLQGSPKFVDNFYCDNNLTSLEGCPKFVNENFDCWNNTKNFTKDEVKQFSNVKGQINVN